VHGELAAMGSQPQSARRQVDAFHVWTGLVACTTPLLVAGIGLVLLWTSRLSLARFGLGFWTSSSWDPVEGRFGALPFIWGTLYSSVLALALATPVALGIAIYIAELAPRAVRRPLTFLTDLLAAIPSIVYGLWGIFVLVPGIRSVELLTPAFLRRLPLFSGPPVGVGMMSAAVILAIMIVPFISSVSREILRSVPQAQREASYALGATRWEAIRVVLHYGRVGIFGAVMLGFGRALGETMAVAMLIGNNPQISLSLFAPQHTMAAVIANEFTEAASDLYLHALIEIGLVLFTITLFVNMISRLLIRSLSSPAQLRPVARMAAPAVAKEAA
jgi:phosphate transport system permease protein